MIAVFNRLANTAACGDITVQPRGDGDFVFPLCRALVAAGVEDGPLTFRDERGMDCLNVKSIYRAAGLSYSETDRGLRIVKYVPFDRSKVSA